MPTVKLPEESELSEMVRKIDEMMREITKAPAMTQSARAQGLRPAILMVTQAELAHVMASRTILYQQKRMLALAVASVKSAPYELYAHTTRSSANTACPRARSSRSWRPSPTSHAHRCNWRHRDHCARRGCRLRSRSTCCAASRVSEIRLRTLNVDLGIRRTVLGAIAIAGALLAGLASGRAVGPLAAALAVMVGWVLMRVLIRTGDAHARPEGNPIIPSQGKLTLIGSLGIAAWLAPRRALHPSRR